MEDARIHDGDVLVFDECAPRPDSEALMNAVDRINRAGKGRMFLPARVSMCVSRCAGKC
jgi:hypothetical protein